MKSSFHKIFFSDYYSCLFRCASWQTNFCTISLTWLFNHLFNALFHLLWIYHSKCSWNREKLCGSEFKEFVIFISNQLTTMLRDTIDMQNKRRTIVLIFLCKAWKHTTSLCIFSCISKIKLCCYVLSRINTAVFINVFLRLAVSHGWLQQRSLIQRNSVKGFQ